MLENIIMAPTAIILAAVFIEAIKYIERRVPKIRKGGRNE